jgi:hypothetical protein
MVAAVTTLGHALDLLEIAMLTTALALAVMSVTIVLGIHPAFVCLVATTAAAIVLGLSHAQVVATVPALGHTLIGETASRAVILGQLSKVSIPVLVTLFIMIANTPQIWSESVGAIRSCAMNVMAFWAERLV